MVEHWNSDGGTLCWDSGIVTEEQCWWNRVVEHWNSDGGTAWWKGGTVMVEQCGGTVEQCCATVLWNSGTVMVEQCW